METPKFLSQAKTAVKLAVCHIFFYSGMLHLLIKYGLMQRKEFPVVIINYHSFVDNLEGVMDIVPTVTHRIADFEREVVFLKKYFDIVSIDHVVDVFRLGRVFSRPTIAITIDDGFKDNYDLLFSVVKRHNIPVTIFLTTGLIGTNKKAWVNNLSDMILKTSQPTLNLNGLFEAKSFPLSTIEDKRTAYVEIVRRLKNIDIRERDRFLKELEKQLGAPDESSPLMLNWDEIRTMAKHNVFFGAHTVTHPILTNMPLEDAQKEILESKRHIEKELGTKVRHFAFPNGRPQDFNETMREYCKKIGFDSVSSCDYGFNEKASDVWGLKRIGSELPVSLFAVNVLRAFTLNKGFSLPLDPQAQLGMEPSN